MLPSKEIALCLFINYAKAHRCTCIRRFVIIFYLLISLRGKSQEAMTAYRRDFLFALDLVIIIVFNYMYTYINKEQQIIK